jgi:hypothetical protein
MCSVVKQALTLSLCGDTQYALQMELFCYNIGIFVKRISTPTRNIKLKPLI